MNSPYHPGELAVQQRMGQTDVAARTARLIHNDIPPQAATFLAQQPMVVIAAAGGDGRVWTSLLTGRPGFARVDNSQTILVEALPAPGGPLADTLQGPCRIGMVVVEPQRRRRMRANGTARPAGDGIRIHVDQVYSNCSKYISRRHIEQVGETPEGHRTVQIQRTATLGSRQRQAITDTDTFFVGSTDRQGNADASHRGGHPGFLQALSPRRLRWPDYPGNAMFGTLGNIYANPLCGLLILDWTSGTTLQLTGSAEISWVAVKSDPDAQCWIDFALTEVIEIGGAVDGAPTHLTRELQRDGVEQINGQTLRE